MLHTHHKKQSKHAQICPHSRVIKRQTRTFTPAIAAKPISQWFRPDFAPTKKSPTRFKLSRSTYISRLLEVYATTLQHRVITQIADELTALIADNKPHFLIN